MRVRGILHKWVEVMTTEDRVEVLDAIEEFLSKEWNDYWEIEEIYLCALEQDILK